MNQELVLAVKKLLEQVQAVEEPRYYTQENSPLGRRKHIARIQDGSIDGYKDGRTFFALRSNVHDYIEKHPVRRDDDSESSGDIDSLLDDDE